MASSSSTTAPRVLPRARLFLIMARLPPASRGIATLGCVRNHVRPTRIAGLPSSLLLYFEVNCRSAIIREATAMTQKPQLKSATVDFIRSFTIRNWRETLLGFLLGALLGFGLKMIRGVPEFPQFTYVCAFDEYALVRTLRHNDSLKSQEEAQHFLEKFFPDKVPLPKIDESLLAVEYEKRFFSICDRNKFLLDPEERKKFQDEWRTIWQTSIKRYITNLRRLNLFTNRLNRILPLIGDEVNLKDLVLLELIRMINPVIYEDIFRNAPYFMFAGWRWTTLIQVLHIDENEEKKRSTTYFEALFKDLPRPPEGVLLGLLAEVFPTVEYYLKNSVVPGRIRNNQDTAERERRVFHPDFFPRYFMFKVPHSQFSEKELSGFISTMNE